MLAGVQAAFACTSLIAGKNATADGSTMITYNADAYVLYGELYRQPAADTLNAQRKTPTLWSAWDDLSVIYHG